MGGPFGNHYLNISTISPILDSLEQRDGPLLPEHNTMQPESIGNEMLCTARLVHRFLDDGMVCPKGRSLMAALGTRQMTPSNDKGMGLASRLPRKDELQTRPMTTTFIVVDRYTQLSF